MFTTIEQFKNIWEQESGGTKKMFAALTDESLSQAVADDHRTLGRMAWHITQTLPEMAGQTGLKVDGPGEKDPMPDTAAEILKAYETASASFLEQIATKWSDETLEVEDNMYCETWKRGLTLFILIKHEVHHRGQMTVLMRQAGLKVPGIYGPSKEEWGNCGGESPTV